MTSSTPAARRLDGALRHVLGGPLPIGLRVWDGGQLGPRGGPQVVLHRRRALRHLLWRPDELGLARAYVTGDLDVEGDLTEGLRRIWALARSGELGATRLGPVDRLRLIGWALRLGAVGTRPARPAGEARPTGTRHSLRRDRTVIAHHYDTSNDFYRLLLDDHLAYSCGYWRRDQDESSLATAQTDKLELLCRKLGLRPGTRFLDVGCGWGSLLLYAAEHHGVEATGITLSSEQRDHVADQIERRGLGDRVRVLQRDYREFDGGPFDAVACVEMGEHVGQQQYPTFAARLHDLLGPGGRLVLQQMSRRGHAPGGGAFIETYIAPDMDMVPVGLTLQLLEDAGLEVRDVEALREHYVRTVRAWADTLEQRWDEAVALVGREVARTWRLYLAGGALAFEENRMGVDQIVAVRPTVRGASRMPATRERWTDRGASGVVALEA